MSRKANLTEGEETFVRAAYDQLADTEIGLSVEITTEMVKTARRGVFTVVMTVWDIYRGERGRKLAKLSREWPGSTAKSLGAHLYQMSVSVTHLAESAAFSVRPMDDPPA
jgi:hypothetical protein